MLFSIKPPWFAGLQLPLAGGTVHIEFNADIHDALEALVWKPSQNDVRRQFESWNRPLESPMPP